MTESLQRLTEGAFALAYQMLGKREDAMDIIQDAATVAINHTSAPETNSNEFKPWFYKVVRNKSLDQLRRQQRFIHESLEHQSLTADSASSPDIQLEQLQLKDSIHNALMCISIEQREIVLLKDYHSFNYEQIAEILDIPKGSVMSRLHRARLALRKLLVATESVEKSNNDSV